MDIGIVKKFIFALLVTILICPVNQAKAGEKFTSDFPSTYKNRDNAMADLIEKNQDIVKKLQGLSEKEKSAVIALVAVTKAVTMYETFSAKKK